MTKHEEKEKLKITFNDGTQIVELTFIECNQETKMTIEFNPPKESKDGASTAESWAAQYIKLILEE